jgi:murein DD-endopeptidase MepM/ murein hydrolase activator NlpD
MSGVLWPLSAAGEPLGLPVACDLGRSCWVQNWVDMDPGPGRADPACGPLTYDGHDGIDIRVPYSAMRRGVAVLAPGAGVVKGVRNDAPDGVNEAGRECGNGVVIDHGDGLESQLCHLQRGSVLVGVGERVVARQPIGRIGLSGMTEFPHVHMAVRRRGAKIDPFTGEVIGAGQCRLAPVPAPGVFADPPDYVASAIVAAGFVEAAPARAAEAERMAPADGDAAAPALVGYAVVMGPRSGARTELRLVAPDGAEIAANTVVHEKDQAQYALFTGRKRPAAGWPGGRYKLRVRYSGADGAVLEREEALLVR